MMAESSGSEEAEGTKKKPFPHRLDRLWGRLLGRLLGVLVLLVLLGYGVSNLWLMSPWGKGMVEKKLSERTGLDWHLGSMSWSPWNGLSMGEVRMLPPDGLREESEGPVVEIKSITVQPYWSRMLRGQGMRPREVLVDSPQLRVSLELLAAMAADRARDEQLIEELPPAKPPTPPELAAGPGQPELPELANMTTGPVAQVPPPLSAPAPQQPPPATSPTPPVVKRPPAGPPTRLRVSNGSVRLVSLGKQLDLLSMDQISMDLPVYGEDAKGKIKVARLQVPGFPELHNLEQEIVWKRPFLQVEEQVVDLGGLNLRFVAQLAMGRHPSGSYPFLVNMVIDPQQVESIEGLQHVGLDVGGDILVGKFRLLGLLPSPMSWQGEMLMLGKGISVKRGKGQEVVFDDVYLPAILHLGQLRWGNAKMVGEDLSVLGNGRISMHGGSVLAVARLVASPEVALELSKSLQRAEIKEGPWWHDLGTPDRAARDLTVSGSIYDPVVDAGDNYSSVRLARLIGPIFKAASPEVKNTGAGFMVPVPLPEKGVSNGKK